MTDNLDDFLMRTISLEYDDMSVHRMRTSKGVSNITVRIGSFEITFSSNEHGSGYEQKALKLAEMITTIAHNGCTLPES